MEQWERPRKHLWNSERGHASRKWTFPRRESSLAMLSDGHVLRLYRSSFMPFGFWWQSNDTSGLESSVNRLYLLRGSYAAYIRLHASLASRNCPSKTDCTNGKEVCKDVGTGFLAGMDSILAKNPVPTSLHTSFPLVQSVLLVDSLARNTTC